MKHVEVVILDSRVRNINPVEKGLRILARSRAGAAVVMFQHFGEEVLDGVDDFVAS